MDVELEVLEDARAAARRAAEHLAEAVRRGGAIALSGGSARDAYEAAVELEPSWREATVFFADERCVSPDDPRSNYRLVRESVLDRVTERPAVARVPCERPPQAAADLYDDTLREVALEFAFLGIGPDGHTASLFPHAPALDERERRAVAAEPALEPFVPRVTMTIPMLATARLALYLVTGDGKADAVARTFGADPDPATPASLVRGRRTVVVADCAAAAYIEEPAT